MIVWIILALLVLWYIAKPIIEEGSTSPGTLLQLVAKGDQDLYLTGPPTNKIINQPTILPNDKPLNTYNDLDDSYYANSYYYYPNPFPNPSYYPTLDPYYGFNSLNKHPYEYYRMMNAYYPSRYRRHRRYF